jgi:hypothetical protein
MTDKDKLDWLYDRARIIDVVTRFAVAIDCRDWDLYETCFTEEVTFDYPTSGGHRVLKASEIRYSSPPFFLCFDATQHISANHQVEIEGDEATCISTLHARHFRDGEAEGPLQVQIGHYRNHLRREGEMWKIFLSEQKVSWSEGNQSMFESALAERRRQIEARTTAKAQ